MTKPRCVLHLGTMKTGTTSIQSWLKLNRQNLKRDSWVYPGWPFRTPGMFSERVQECDPEENLIVSDEGLWHFGGTERSRTDEIANVLKGYDVRAIVYFRRPDQFLEAWFKQGLKRGTGAHSLSRFLGHGDVRDSVLTRLNFFANIFGEENLVVAPYERSQFVDGDLIKDFVAKAGLPSDYASGGRATGSDNISPSADAMLLAGIMRKVFGTSQDIIDAFLNSAGSPSDRSRKTTVLTPQEIREITDHYRPQFEEIQARFGSGAAPGFFSSWEDGSPAQMSPLRGAYNKYMQRLHTK